MRISKVEVLGEVIIPESNIASSTVEFLKGSYFWVVPKNSSLFYSKDKLQKFLLQKFPRIESLKVSLKNLETIEINLAERSPFGMWCKKLEGDMSEQCYFLDEQGFIYSEAPQFSGNVYFKYYGGILSDQFMGQNYLSPNIFGDINGMIDKARSFGFVPLFISTEDSKVFEISLENGGRILFDLKQPVSKTEDNLTLLLRTEPFTTTTPNSVPIDYIDLRFGNKLFYKLK